jgi:hypothetical protein
MHALLSKQLIFGNLIVVAVFENDADVAARILGKNDESPR